SVSDASDTRRTASSARASRAARAPMLQPATAWAAIGLALLLLGSRAATAFDGLWETADSRAQQALSLLLGAGHSFSALWTRVGERWFDDLALLALLAIFIHRFLRGSVDEVRHGVAV